MESGPTEAVFAEPSHPYTTGLLQAVPRLDRADELLRTIPGDPPDMTGGIAGCPFAPRCDLAEDRCLATAPDLVGWKPSRRRACHRTLQETVA